MREIPILFSTPMVQAILDGRKSMTRRVIKPQPFPKWIECGRENIGDWQWCFYDANGGYGLLKQHCPYGQPGDRLWVRETWAELSQFHNLNSEIERYIYKADEDATPLKWKPSIFMPKEAARIWLEVVNVRVERLQEITYEDCLREGMWNYGTDVDTLAAFQELWQNLNAKRGYDWNINPWVWAISFRRVEA